MTTTIDLSGVLRFLRDGEEFAIAKSDKMKWDAGKAVDMIQEVGTNWEELNIGDIGTPGEPSWILLYNMAVDGFYVEVGSIDGDLNPLVRIDPQKFAGPFQLNIIKPHVRAVQIPSSLPNPPLPQLRYVVVERIPTI